MDAIKLPDQYRLFVIQANCHKCSTFFTYDDVVISGLGVQEYKDKLVKFIILECPCGVKTQVLLCGIEKGVESIVTAFLEEKND